MLHMPDKETHDGSIENLAHFRQVKTCVDRMEQSAVLALHVGNPTANCGRHMLTKTKEDGFGDAHHQHMVQARIVLWIDSGPKTSGKAHFS